MITIVTPTLDASGYVENAILSVLEQDAGDFEHIVIDGGSTDGTINILRRFPHLRWISEPDSGQANALNKGFRMARGEIIGWLNADDSYTPGAMQTAINYLQNDEKGDIVYGDCRILREDGSVLTTFRPGQTKVNEKLYKLAIHTPAVFFRKRIFDRVGYLDESYHYNLDNEFWLRAAPKVKQIYLPYTLANFVHRSDSKTTSAHAEFGPELCRMFSDAFEKEPYRSQVPREIQEQVIGRTFWSTGVNLLLDGQKERAKSYLHDAIHKYGLLRWPDVMADCTIVRYVQRDVVDESTLMCLVEALPLEAHVRQQVSAIVRKAYQGLRFYAAFNRQDWQEVKSAGYRMIVQHPQILAKRGFMSIWAKALSGEWGRRVFRAFRSGRLHSESFKYAKR